MNVTGIPMGTGPERRPYISPFGSPSVPVPGTGTLLRVSTLGYSVSVAPKRAGFNHPFIISLGLNNRGALVRLTKGVVETFEPTIGTVPISGGLNIPQPSLTLDPSLQTAGGESYICLEVVPEKDGTLIATSSCQVAHRNNPVSLDPNLGRCALGLVLWNGNRALKVFQIVYFNLRYSRVIPPAGGGAVRHYFW